LRILLADDHTILRQGLRTLLEMDSAYDVVGEAQDGLQAVELAECRRPEIIIMDIAMPVFDGIKATEKIKKRFSSEIKVIILSMHDDKSFIRQAFKAGASGFLLKETAFDELKVALEVVREGKLYLSPSLLQSVLQSYLASTSDEEIATKYERLTPREKEVLRLLLKGCRRQEVAELLYISLKTVDQHKKKIKEKLEIKNEEELHKFLPLSARFDE